MFWVGWELSCWLRGLGWGLKIGEGGVGCALHHVSSSSLRPPPATPARIEGGLGRPAGGARGLSMPRSGLAAPLETLVPPGLRVPDV